MSLHKKSGCCTLCDEPCFEVVSRWEATERYPGEPKRLGQVIGDATRISYMLLDGTKCDLTFCENCAGTVSGSDYVEIWRKVCRSWKREMELTNQTKPDWYWESLNNGILSEMGRVLWRDLNG